MNTVDAVIKLQNLIVLGFNDMSTLVGHFVSSPREREKRDRVDEREGQGRKSEETEEIKTFPLYPYLLQGQQAFPNCKPISVGRPGDVRYAAISPHLTTPSNCKKNVCLFDFTISLKGIGFHVS